MKARSTLLSLIIVVACVIASSYLIRQIIAERSSRMTQGDKCVLRLWLTLVREYQEMQDLPSRADFARSWAKTAAEEYSRQSGMGHGWTRILTADDCPAGLTLTQAELIRHFVWRGLNAGAVETRDSRNLTWIAALAGAFPEHDKKPSECLDPHVLDQYPREPLQHEIWYTHSIPRPQDVVANRDALERLSNHRELVELIDHCWHIGYQAGCPLSDQW